MPRTANEDKAPTTKRTREEKAAPPPSTRSKSAKSYPGIIIKDAADEWLVSRNLYLRSSYKARIDVIDRGVSARSLVGAAEAMGVSHERFYNIVGLASSTAKRKVSRNENLDPYVTERLMQIGAVEKLAEDVFGDPDLASEWLQTRNISLGNVTPLSMLGSENGRNEVSRVLNAIAYGGVA